MYNGGDDRYIGFHISAQDMLNHYDFNGDGRVTTQDYVALKQLIGLDPG